MEKKYSVSVENDQVVSIEINGIRYDSPEQISDPQDRARIEQLISNSKQAQSSEDEGFEEAFHDESFDTEAFDREFAEDFRQLEQQSRRFPVLIFAIFAGIALIMLAIAAISAANSMARLAKEKSAPGQVVDMVVRRYQEDNSQTTNEYYFPVVEFTTLDQARQKTQLAEGSWPPAYQVGEEVTVLYDPDHPSDARIQSAGSTLLMWLLPGITGTIGAAFLLAAGVVVWMQRKEQDGSLQNSVN